MEEKWIVYVFLVPPFLLLFIIYLYLHNDALKKYQEKYPKA